MACWRRMLRRGISPEPVPQTQPLPACQRTGAPLSPSCSGDCKLGEKEEGCTPRLAHWRESALTYAALAGGAPIDLQGMECTKPEKDVQVNTTFAGAAWEWMEDWLNVKEGDSGNTVPKQYRSGQFKQDAAA
jgi:hypothetical protein